jgi:hypothetical protein
MTKLNKVTGKPVAPMTTANKQKWIIIAAAWGYVLGYWFELYMRYFG